jgi:hypothetical protein
MRYTSKFEFQENPVTQRMILIDHSGSLIGEAMEAIVTDVLAREEPTTPFCAVIGDMNDDDRAIFVRRGTVSEIESLLRDPPDFGIGGLTPALRETDRPDTTVVVYTDNLPDSHLRNGEFRRSIESRSHELVVALSKFADSDVVAKEFEGLPHRVIEIRSQ